VLPLVGNQDAVVALLAHSGGLELRRGDAGLHCQVE
jgi:hypothetical protein